MNPRRQAQTSAGRRRQHVPAQHEWSKTVGGAARQATSALDVESEAQVQAALDRAMRTTGRSVLVIAHRRARHAGPAAAAALRTCRRWALSGARAVPRRPQSARASPLCAFPPLSSPPPLPACLAGSAAD